MNTPPLPEPNPDVDSLIFTTSFWRFCGTCTFLTWVLSFPFLAFLVVPSGNIRLIIITFALGSLIGFITVALLTYIQMHLYPVVINSSEIRSANAWGVIAQVKWTEISSVKRTGFLTLSYLKVSTPQKKSVIWLPLFLSDMKGFRTAVAHFVAPGNPLRVALEC